LGGPLPVRFQRYYASLLERNGRVQSALGPNWMHTFDRRLIRIGSSTVEAVLQRGRIVRFVKESEAWTQVTLPERPYQLREAGDGYRVANPRSQRIYTFDAAGRLTQIADGRGNPLALTYGGRGRLTEVSDGLGRTLTFSYSNDRLARVSDGRRTVTFDYTDGLLAGATDPLGNRTTYNYETGHERTGLLIEKTRPGGNTILTQTYDAEGRVSSQTDAPGNTTTLAYSTDTETGEQVTTVNEAGGGTTVHVHDADGRLRRVTDASGQTIDLGYSDGGQRDRITDRLGDATLYTFDPASRLPTTVTDAQGGVTRYNYATRTDDGFSFHELAAVDRPDGTSVTYQYDGDGNPTSITGPAGGTHTLTYNDRGQPLTVANPEGGTMTFSYNGDATLAAITDPSGNTTSYAYDDLRRPVTIARPDGTTQGLEYDAAGRVTARTDEEGRTTSFTYDANGNLTSITDPSGQTVRRSYDAMDRLTRTTDRTGQSTTYAYDARGRLETITDRTGNTATLGYDTEDRLTSIRDGAGQTWTIRYDAEGVPTALTNPGGETTTLTSNAMGWITQVTSPEGHAMSRTYDSMGRITAVQDPGGGTTQMPRSARGLLDGMVLPGGASATYDRDGLGLLEQRTGPEDGRWATPRDAQGRVTRQTDPLGRTATNTHDARNRVTQVEQPEGLGAVTLTYDGTSRLTGLAHSGGPSLSYSYDASGRLTEATGVSLQREAEGRVTETNGLAVTRDADGRIASVTLPGGTVRYRYDGAGRLAEVEDWQDGVTAFRYDESGRLAEITRPNGTVTTYDYDGDGRVVEIEETNGNGSILAASTLTRDARGQVTQAERTAPVVPELTPEPERFAYDAAGQVEGSTYDALGRVTEDGARTYTWDGLSRLVSISDSAGATQFTYDAFGHRVSRTSGGTTRRYVWNYALGLPSVAVETEGGSDQRYYVHAPNGALLYSVDATGGGRRFYHYDETGNTRLLTGEDGTVQAAYAYTPYGRVAAQQGNVENPFTWQGRFGVMNDGNGLYYARARYYDAATRRFLAPDPIESGHPAEISPYQYARGTPTQFTDPTGLAPESEPDNWYDQYVAPVMSVAVPSLGLASEGIDALTAPGNSDAVETASPSRLRSVGQKLGIVGNILGIYNEYMSSGSIGQTTGATLNGMLSNSLGLGASALDLGGATAGADDYSNFTNFLILPGRLIGASAEDLITGSSFIDGVLTQYGQIGPSLPFFEVGQNIGDALGLPGLIQPDVVGEMINTTTLQANDGSRSAQRGNVVSLNPGQQGTDAESESCVPSGGSSFEISFGPFRRIITAPTFRDAPLDKRPGIMNELPLKLVIC
jgi:RHS repeat-associated protein